MRSSWCKSLWRKPFKFLDKKEALLSEDSKALLMVAEAGKLQLIKTRTYVLLGCPANVLGDGAPASLADPGHALPSLLPPPAAVGSLPSGNPEVYLRLAT